MKKHNGHLDRIRQALLLMFLAVAWLAPADHAHAQSPDAATQAKAHYELGMTAYGLGHYDRAVQAFLRAYQVDPAPILLYNVAQAYWKKGQNEAAVIFYRRYLDADPKAKNRARIRARIRDLQSGKKVAPPSEAAAQVVPPAIAPPLSGDPAEDPDVESELEAAAAMRDRAPVTTEIEATAGTRERAVAVPFDATAGNRERHPMTEPHLEATPEPSGPAGAVTESAPGDREPESTELAATAGTRERVAAEERAEHTAEAETREDRPVVAELGPAAVGPNGEPLAAETGTQSAGGRPLSPDLFTVVEPARTPVYRRPWFWPALGALSLATAAAIVLVRPDQRSWSCGLECMGTREIP